MSNSGVDPAAGVNAESGGRAKVGLAVSPSSGKNVQTIRTQSIMRQVGGKGSMRRADEIQKVLSELDRDQDGNIDVAELVDMLEGIIKSRRERRYMWFVIIALFVFAACTIGTIIGLTYAVVDALKDTEVNGSVMYVKGSDTEVVKVGSADFTVVGNAMVARSAAATANATNSSSVMQTAAFPGIRQPLSSRLPIDTLFELKFLHIKGVGEAELGVVVSGVARVPLAGSVHGSVVRMITAAGTITLDGTVLTFSSTIADIFEEAGFRVSGSRRALIGEYYVFGFFNAIEDLTVFDLPAGEAKPKLPDTNFVMSLQVYQACTQTGVPVDKCTYVVPSDNIDLSGRRLLADAATARRSVQGTDQILADIPGVVTDADGARWLSHNETIVSWQGKIRTESYFVPYPGLRMVQLNDGTSSDVQIWQESYDEVAPLAAIEYMFCRATALPEGAKGMQLNNYILNFTYRGVDELSPKSYARHFTLTAKQPATTALITIDYWDTTDANNYPVRFEITDSIAGSTRMDVVKFAVLTASSEQVQSVRWSKPTTCPDRATVPMLTSPFAMRTGAAVVSSEVGSRRHAMELYNPERRALQSTSCANEKYTDLYSGAWGPCTAKLGALKNIFLNGSMTCTGSWGPFSFNGGMTGNLCELKASGCLTLDVAVPSNWLTNLINLKDFQPFSACAVYDPNAKFFTVTGSVRASIGVAYATAAFSLRFSACCIWIDKVTVDGYVWSFFGGYSHVGSIDVLQQTFLRGTSTDLTNELSTTVSNVNSWLTLGEGFEGAWMDQKLCVTYAYGTNPAKVTYGMPVKSYQLRMDTSTSGDKMALNGVKLGCSDSSSVTLTEGQTGSWVSATCSGEGKLNAARIRIEAKKAGADNTAANAISFKCDNDEATELIASEGYAGEWGAWQTCPAGTYICGMQVRYQGYQGSMDDTAVNGAKIACCNPVSLSA